MRQFKIMTISGGDLIINCDEYEYSLAGGWVRFLRGSRYIAIFNISQIVGVIEEDNEDNGEEDNGL